jgi:hypothetical protein
MTITSARRTPGKLIDTRQNLQSIQPTFLETGILFYSTGALRLLHSNKTFGRGVIQVAEVFRILGSVKHCSRYPLETRQS